MKMKMHFLKNFQFSARLKWKIMLSILDNGKMDRDGVKVNKYGVMVLNTRDIGLMIWLMVGED